MKYGFFGCGNMGGAIAAALSNTTKDMALCDRSGKAKVLADQLGVSYADGSAVMHCQRIFLGVKPHMMKEALLPYQQVLAESKPLLISMAAGLTTQQIRDFAGTDLPVIRIMPNTPTLVGKGVIPYCCNELVSEEMLENWLQDMEVCGLCDPLPENLMDAASALSGSGPAYLYVLLEALADGAVACGLPREKALRYGAMTMAGAAQMFLTTGKNPGKLKDEVCSPGGSTIAGIRQLEDKGFRGAAMDCVMAAYKRNLELGK